MKKINFNDKLYDILNGDDKLLQFFINNGFDQLNEKMLKTMGKMISLNMALRVKGINKSSFEEKLNSFLNDEHSLADKSLAEKKDLVGDIVIKGILPCPLKIPIQEAIEDLTSKNRSQGLDIAYDLKSANLGLDWLEDDINTNDITKIPDIIISAGFKLFFDKDKFADFFQNKQFYIENPKMNREFDNEKLSLRDPKNLYHIIGVVPCVFLVNENNLKDKKAPSSWEELLFSGDYNNKVAIPLGDLDMFNAIVVNIFAKWGLDGIKALAKVYNKSLHPAEMVKNKNHTQNTHLVSIIPYFFTQIIPENSSLRLVWPEEGAIISPIFMIAKRSNENANKVLSFFRSENFGKLLSANGKFPTTILGVDNKLAKNQDFLFCGWDFIHKNDIVKIMREAEKIFKAEILK